MRFFKQPSPLYVHILLFAVSFFTTALAGAMWANKDYTNLVNIQYGLTYATLILFFLAAHEFGHYFASKIHKVDASLPYFIPFPPLLYMPTFGTFGAVIKTRTPILSKRALFDIGAAGPIAGFIVCIVFLIIGFATLPPKEFIYTIHPEYRMLANGVIPSAGMHFGDTLLYSAFASIFANPNGWLPPTNEIYHYPLLNVGWFGLFVTTLNLLPIGQLDGGHICYALFGKHQEKIARYFFWILIILSVGSILGMLYDILQYDDPSSIYVFLQDLLLPVLSKMKVAIPWFFQSWNGWLLWALLGRFLFKFKHPEVYDEQPLNTTRKVIGWFCIAIFILSFSYNGLFVVE